MNSIKISAAILTFNNEKHIDDVLKKLFWCDEIIIMDSYSTDATLSICKKYPTIIHQNTFEGFGLQKQLLLEKCKNDWIISIDSDEILSDDLIENILNLTTKNFTDHSGFLIKRRHIFLNRKFLYGKESEIWILRLFDKTKGGVTDNIVHESIKTNGKTAKLNGDLLHYTIDELKELISKMDFYARLKAKEYYNNGRKSSWYKLYLNSPYTFFREYVLHRNFMNGYEGYLWATLVAQGAGLKYHYLKELHNSKN